jgi:hypothetical protein
MMIHPTALLTCLPACVLLRLLLLLLVLAERRARRGRSFGASGPRKGV